MTFFYAVLCCKFRNTMYTVNSYFITWYICNLRCLHILSCVTKKNDFLPYLISRYHIKEKKSGKIAGLASDFLAVEEYVASISIRFAKLYIIYHRIDVSSQGLSRLFYRAVFDWFLGEFHCERSSLLSNG